MAPRQGFSWRKFFGSTHLVLGLASGLVVLVVALTGALWAFESELSDLFYPYRTVAPQKVAYLPPSALVAAAQPHFGVLAVQGVYYHGSNRAAELVWYSPEEGSHDQVRAYLNPYSGEVLHVGHNERGFFDVVIDLHVSLLLGEVGTHIVDFATLFFLLLLISGIVLWWPRNSAAVGQRLRFKWKPGLKWRRKNYDLHGILGFYASWVVLFVAITGLAWAFSWVDRGLYAAATLGAPYKPWPEVAFTSPANAPARADLLDHALAQAYAAFGPGAQRADIYLPEEPNEALTIYLNPDGTTWYQSASYFFDQRTGEMIDRYHPAKANSGERLRDMYYDIHIGKVLGLPGQVLVCAGSLIVASLPVTGFCLWWGRRKKEPRARVHQPVAATA